ncbi:MAG: hypothetical protein AAF582_05805 [Pseudomonadota bacterium]
MLTLTNTRLHVPNRAERPNLIVMMKGTLQMRIYQWWLSLVVAVFLGLVQSSVYPQQATSQAHSEAVAAARQVMDDFMTTFNARDEKAWAETFHYPHIRIASGEVSVADSAEAIMTEMDFARFAEMTGWHHSAWDSIQVVQAGRDKVHFSVEFTRFDEDGEPLRTYQSLYVVTKRGDRWGVQARSSFAP